MITGVADLVSCQLSRCLAAQAIALTFLFQVDQAGIVVIVTDSELLPVVDAVQLFPERFVRCIIEVQTSDKILSVHCILVPLHHGA